MSDQSELQLTTNIPRVQYDNLQELSLDELAARFIDIDKQAQLMQGLILLEARNRFPSDRQFGKWVSTQAFCSGSGPHRTRLINLAKFFKDRDLTGISISVAYLISSPKNAYIAEELYDIAKDKPMTVEMAKALIEEVDIRTLIKKFSHQQSLTDKIIKLLEGCGLEHNEKIAILKNCTVQIEAKHKAKRKADLKAACMENFKTKLVKK